MSSLPLHGDWQLALDRADTGVGARWFAGPLASDTVVQLPGALAAQGYGDAAEPDSPWTGTIFDRSYFTASEYAAFRPPAPVRLPFWLTPERVYVGTAWYQREIDIPVEWVGQRIMLSLERPHWQTRAWLGERELGTRDSLATPHDYEVGVFAAAGRHRLTLRIDNRMIVDVGENAHSVSDHTQGNWNGVVGTIELRASAAAWIDDLQVYPDVAARSVRVSGRVAVAAASPLPATVLLDCGAAAATAPVADDGGFAATLALGPDAPLWGEFTPALHTLTARLPNGEARAVRFGLREIRREGRQLLLNGRPLFLRGALDCAQFPLTGYPSTDVAEWRRILGAIREHGLNHVRFHSWCPPEAAFVAGDELGMYFQIEAGTWPNAVAVLAANSPRGIGDGASVDAWTLAEGERILRVYGNHPCFVLFAAGNEPGGPQHREYLARWVEAMRALDSRRLYTGTAGWPELAENDFHVLPEPRAHQWGDGLASRLNATPPATTADYRASVERRDAPVISHEIGQWCAFPDPAAADYNGPLRPGSLEILAVRLHERGLSERAAEFARASGRLQLACYKEEIEAQLRTPGLAGFQLLGLQDFTGQGHAPVGVLDPFWRTKGYASAVEFRRFCAPTVLLARLPCRVFTAGDTLEADLEVAHFGASSLTSAVARWRMEDAAGRVIAQGEFVSCAVPLGAPFALGKIRAPLGEALRAQRLRLVAGLAGTAIENDWNVWVYPATEPAPVPPGVLVTRTLDAHAEEMLRGGGRVVLSGGRGRARGDVRGRVELGFTPIFWNTWCTRRQAPHTLGLVCDPRHAALAEFPTEAHSDWQWWHLLRRADALIVDALPRELRPLVEVIDDWYTCRRLALAFEARVGAGRLLVSSVDLTADLASDPVARQWRASLLAYAASEAFAPTVEVTAEAVRALFLAAAE
ncbi:MAG: hypothetical protein KF715_21310 [Candidatus Didemnitutus sp.]|nr:hypothetical protein [Candidatus Didemnitutus sp.]